MKFRRFIKFCVVMFIVLLCVCAAGCDKGGEEPAVPTAVPETAVKLDDSKAKVILLAGQSNMAGATFTSDVAKDLGSDANKKYHRGFESTQIVYSCGSINVDSNYWNTSKGRMMKVRLGQGATGTQFGPEIGIAEYFSEKYPNETIYLVKHAIGGCPIDYYLEDEKPLVNSFQLMREQFDVAVKTIKDTTGKDVEVIAVCWSQGESESGSEAIAATYKEKLSRLAAAFREEYADYAPEGGISFIDNGISDSSYWVAYQTINNAKKEFAEESMHNYYIDTLGAGLVVGPDNAHYTAESEIRLGRMFAEIISQIIDNG